MGLRAARPSADDRGTLGLPNEEKVLAFAHTIHRQPVAATRTALYLPERCIPWHTIAKAEWAEPFLDVVVTAGPRGELIRLEFEDSGRLAPVIRERVTDSVIISEHRTLPNGGGATLPRAGCPVMRSCGRSASILGSIPRPQTTRPRPPRSSLNCVLPSGSEAPPGW